MVREITGTDAAPLSNQPPIQLWTPPTPTVIKRARRFRRSAFVPNTLSGRLVMGVVTLVIVVVALSGVATYALLKPFLISRLDQQVGGIATSNANSIELCLVSNRGCFNINGVSSTQGSLPSTVTEWLVGYGSDGSVGVRVNAGIDHVKQLDLSTHTIHEILANPTKPRTVTTLEGDQLRIAGRSLGPNLGDLVVVSGLSTDEVAHTLQRLLIIELGIGIVATVIAAALTTWGVQTGLRPLRRVTRTAQEVTAELGPDGAGLERRVPDADPTTEVGQVASSMNTLLEAVQNEFAARVESEDRMRQFLADASHELRTPLTSIRGYAELSRLQGQSSNSSDDPMRRIEVEGTRMSRLVEDLLVLARGDDRTNERRQEPVDVDSLLSDAIGSVASAHPEREYDLTPSGGAVVIGDRDQLLRLVLNLLNNASVHTAPGPAIRLEGVRGRTDSGPAVALRVIDAGPGLPPEEAAHVFERFWRADKARTRAKGGSGLGMAIVAQIAETHGGSITFDSSVERGTTVTVTLPLVTGQPGTAAAPPWYQHSGDAARGSGHPAIPSFRSGG